jgi:hypothetical protein
MTVFALIMAMMKYSNGVDVTMCQMRYFIESLSSGMKSERGLAFSAKSMHCFCLLSAQQAVHNRACLVLVQIALGQLLFALLLKRDDDQRDEDVDEEEREYYEEHYVE